MQIALAFFLEVSHLLVLICVQFIIQGFKCLAQYNFFITSLLIPNIVSSEGLFRYEASIFGCQAISWQYSYKHFLYYGPTCSECCKGSVY